MCDWGGGGVAQGPQHHHKALSAGKIAISQPKSDKWHGEGRTDHGPELRCGPQHHHKALAVPAVHLREARA